MASGFEWVEGFRSSQRHKHPRLRAVQCFVIGCVPVRVCGCVGCGIRFLTYAPKTAVRFRVQC